MNEIPYFQGELNNEAPSGEEKAGLGFAHEVVLFIVYYWEKSSCCCEA